MKTTIVITGLGLIGGSMALALKKSEPLAELIGIDNHPLNAEKALELGLINRIGTEQDYLHADLIILAIPVNAIRILLPELLSRIKPGALLIDLGSTKQGICDSVFNHPNRGAYLSAHPIAGTEFSGPEAALPDLFENKTNILCDIELTHPNLLLKAQELFTSIGMRLRFMDSAGHDLHIAYCSHLSHALSFMLANTALELEENEKELFEMAGSGFASTVRLAKSSPDMWVPIFIENQTNILQAMDKYIKNLSELRTLIATKNHQTLKEKLTNANRIKPVLEGLLKPTR